MNITLKLPNPQQHQRVFLDDLILRYRSKLISAADYILGLTNIYRPKGQKLNIPSAKAFYTQFNIPKSTFYRATKRLQKLPELGFRWEPSGGISMWIETEGTASSNSAPEKEESKYTRLKDLPKALRNEFESFVRGEWRKLRGEEIISFYRFLKDSADFQNWWDKFQNHQHKMTATTAVAAAATTAVAPEASSKRAFSPIPENLKGLFGRKPT